MVVWKYPLPSKYTLEIEAQRKASKHGHDLSFLDFAWGQEHPCVFRATFAGLFLLKNIVGSVFSTLFGRHGPVSLVSASLAKACVSRTSGPAVMSSRFIYVAICWSPFLDLILAQEV